MDLEKLNYSNEQMKRTLTTGTKDYNSMYRFRHKYLTIWQHICEWKLCRGEFILERPSSETQSISVAMERWSVEHRAFAVETYF